MKKEEYCFDGTAKVYCKKCKTLHEVAFDGTDLDCGVEEAIERGMSETGWDAVNHICPNCWEEFEGTDEDDSIDPEYDIELDEDEYEDILDGEEE